LTISGTTKNEISEIIVKFITEGTDDIYEKKVSVSKVFIKDEYLPEIELKPEDPTES
jgi:hypothetical protein